MRPLEFAPLSGRRTSTSLLSAGVLPSLALHALVLVASGAQLIARDADDDRPAHEVVFLAPLLPRNDPANDAAAGDGLPGGILGWRGLDAASQGVADAVGSSYGAADGRGTALQRAVSTLETPPTDETPRLGDEHVFQAVDVDREVERQGEAVAPIYPESLRLTNVQGGVIVQFVVDTTGHAEPSSLTVIGSTHPLFSAAVREAIPSMRFRPAVRSGRSVRQQVVQSFQFVLAPVTAPTPPADTATTALTKQPAPSV